MPCFSARGSRGRAQRALRGAQGAFFRGIGPYQLRSDVSRFAQLAARREAFDGVRKVPRGARGVVLRAAQSRGKLVELRGPRVAAGPARFAGGLLQAVGIDVGGRLS